MAFVAQLQGDHDQQYALIEQRLAIHNELGDEEAIEGDRAALAAAAGHYGPLRARLERGLEKARRSGNQREISHLLNSLGIFTSNAGDLPGARRLLQECVELRREIDPDGARFPLIHLGHVVCRQGEHAGARSLLCESLRICRRLGDKRLAAECLESLAEVAEGEGQLERAARLLGAAESLREIITFALSREDRPHHDRVVAAVRQTMDEPSFAAAWRAGYALSWQQATDYALDE
jgi:hypothetical protein